MKFSLKWAQKYSNVGIESMPLPDLLASIGEQLGAVEEVYDLRQKYADIRIVKVETVAKHTNSDKLNICMVNDDRTVNGVPRNKAGLVQVVCGAPNVKAGMLAVWIPPGATVPSSLDSDPFVIQAKELRGEVSQGMLASPKELDLSDDHEGLLEVESSNKLAVPGAQFADAYDLNDVIIELENKMFTHRPDCFGMLGVARELAGITNQQFTSPDWYTNQTSELGSGFKSQNDIVEQVPRFSVQVIKDVNVAPSSPEIQSDLTRVGAKPINNIVDLTNYYMHLTAQPTHAFDYDKVAKLCSKEVTIFPRMAEDGEELELLNGATVKLTNKDVVIATDKQAIALAGVMGGKQTEVDDSTKNIIVECANFNMYTIRRTSMHHGLFTDAVTRFNKGQSKLQNAIILSKLSSDIIDTAGGSLGDGFDSHPELKATHQPPVRVDATLINNRLGSELLPGEIASLLTNVEFEVEINEKSIAVSAPFWRTDIEIAEDIVEEIGRLYGYDKLPVDLPSRKIMPVSRNQDRELKDRIRQIFAAAGANEVLNYSFVSEKLLNGVGQDPKQAYQLSNALSPELQCYRLSLTPSLLSKVHVNLKAGHDQFAVFEIGKTHLKSQAVDNEGLPAEMDMLSLVYAINDNQADKASGAAYYTARKYLDHLAAKLGTTFHYVPLTEKPKYQVAQPFDWRRSALVSDHKTGNFLGIVGEFTSSTRKNLKLPVNSAGFEINCKTLSEGVVGHIQYQPLSKYPSTAKDITFDVSKTTEFGLVRGYLEHIIGELSSKDGLQFTLSDLDIYSKAKSETKSLTFRIEMSDPSKTLKTDEATSIADKIEKFVKDSLAKQK